MPSSSTPSYDHHQELSIPPPYEALLIISQRLDPRTLAMASCVCKSWYAFFSSDHLWEPLLLSHHPSLSSLRNVDPAVSYHRLFALGHAASVRRQCTLLKPRLSLSHLLFTVNVFHGNGTSPILSLTKAGDDLGDSGCPDGVFHFEVAVRDKTTEVPRSSERLRVAWTTVLKGWGGLFSMIECSGNEKVVGGNERWFSEELPVPGCRLDAAVVPSGLGLVAEVVLEFSGGGEGKMRVEKVQMGLMSVISWRYVSVEDGLRYLQHFLVPSSSSHACYTLTKIKF